MKTILVTLEKSKDLELTEDTQLVLDFSTLREAKLNIKAVKENIKTEVVGVFINAEGSLDITSTNDLPLVETKIDLQGFISKTLKPLSVTVTGIVEKNSDNSTIILNNKIITASENINVDMEPNLIIKTKNIEKASHNLSIGKIDEKQLYYLTSRGMSEKKAKEAILDGFFNKILDKIADTKIKEKVKAYVKTNN